MDERVKQYLQDLHTQIGKSRIKITELMCEVDGFNPIDLRESLTLVQYEIERMQDFDGDELQK